MSKNEKIRSGEFVVYYVALIWLKSEIGDGKGDKHPEDEATTTIQQSK